MRIQIADLISKGYKCFWIYEDFFVCLFVPENRFREQGMFYKYMKLFYILILDSESWHI